MTNIDQKAAYIKQGKYENFTQIEWLNFKDSVFSANKLEIEKYFDKYGFLGIKKFGKQTSYNFFLLTQHCDKFPDFQERVLTSLKIEIDKKNADSRNYAYLYDRVMKNTNRKLLFGTQVSYDSTGKAFPINLEDSINVDTRRIKYKLDSLKSYLNDMTFNHYNMNKQFYNLKGINEPNLYK